jgi:hypothetical protein
VIGNGVLTVYMAQEGFDRPKVSHANVKSRLNRASLKETMRAVREEVRMRDRERQVMRNRAGLYEVEAGHMMGPPEDLMLLEP